LTLTPGLEGASNRYHGAHSDMIATCPDRAVEFLPGPDSTWTVAPSGDSLTAEVRWVATCVICSGEGDNFLPQVRITLPRVTLWGLVEFRSMGGVADAPARYQPLFLPDDWAEPEEGLRITRAQWSAEPAR
jgi:hypothetical protein